MTEPTAASEPTLEARLTYLTNRRWFAGKGRTIVTAELHPLPWLAGVDRAVAVRVELLTVTFADGDRHVYQLPLAYRDEPADGLDVALLGRWSPEPDTARRWVYDAPFDRTAATVLLEVVAGATAAPAGYAAHVRAEHIDTDAPPLVLTGEQSNTSVMYGDTALLKLFRRVQPGHNPDIEAHEAFTAAGSTVAPILLAWLDADWPPAAGRDSTPGSGPQRADLGMLTEFLTTATDGWALAAASVRDLLAEGDLHAEEVGGDFAAEAMRLGATTAIMHQELAAAFGTTSWGKTELAALAERLRDRLAAAIERLPALEQVAPAVRAAYADLDTDAVAAAGVTAQRVHGDFHLGQTMRTTRGWRLIDFEGEPGAPYADRIVFDSPLRDVAGMLRSFDYAAESQLMDLVDAQLAFRAAEWRERNRRAFLRGYHAELSGHAAHTEIGDIPDAEAERAPDEDPAADPVIRAYELDKAVYEAVYEADMRPDWLTIPMNALHRLSAPERA